MKTIIYSQKAPKPIGPYNQGIKIKNTLIVSGQIAIDPISGEIPENISDQTELILHNIQAIIEQSNFSIDNIVKVTIYITDINLIKKVNDIYKKFFLLHKAKFPARSCIEVSRLPKDVKVEIEAMAMK